MTLAKTRPNYMEHVELEPKFCPAVSALISTKTSAIKIVTQVSDTYAVLAVSGKKKDVKSFSRMMQALSSEEKKLKPESTVGEIYWAAQVAGAQCGLYFSSQHYDKEFAPNKKRGFLLGAKTIKAMETTFAACS